MRTFPRQPRSLLAGLLLLGCGTLVAPNPDAGLDPTPTPTGAWPSGTVVNVDLGSPQGPVRDVFGVNKAPTLALKAGGGSVDATRLYTAFGVSQVRLHDVGIDPCTIYKDATVKDLSVTPPQVVTGCSFSNIVKRRSWTVNDATKVDDPASYDFAKTDALLAAAVRSGARIYLRIGASDYGGPNDTGDVESYARVSINLYRHVIGQFKAGAVSYDPAFVEVGNEPDGAFWRGDRADFISAYNLIVDGVRSAAAKAGKTVQVGGSGFTESILDSFGQAGNVANGFVSGVTTARLDFFSAHHYDACSAATLGGAATWLQSLRSQLTAQGASAVPLHLSEWNIGLGNKCNAEDFSSAQSQSFASGFLTLMQDDAVNVTAAHFYAGMPPMALFEASNPSVDGIRVSPAAWALKAHASLKDEVKVKAEVCTSSTACSSGVTGAGAPLLALAAGRASGGHRVLVTNDSGAEQPFTLRVAGLSAGAASATVRRLPSSALAVQGTTSGGTFVPTEASVSTLLAAETATPAALAAVGGVGTLALTVPARALMVVDLP